uniref:Uncharacterized protein n=1 Tax=Lactuca sativa TaxID=4236 RepID=A0A9R1XN33_LACSA|nr:hypothetical protein LSAT_V11C300113450 [Lactuca sativa]
MKRSPTGNPYSLPHTTIYLQPFLLQKIISNQSICHFGFKRKHNQSSVTQTRQLNVLSIQLQAQNIWHSVNLRPQDRHLLKLPYTNTASGTLRYNPHHHNPSSTFRQRMVPRLRREWNQVFLPNSGIHFKRHYPIRIRP